MNALHCTTDFRHKLSQPGVSGKFYKFISNRGKHSLVGGTILS